MILLMKKKHCQKILFQNVVLESPKKEQTYFQPLIEGESFPKFDKGIPVYEGLDLHLREI